MPWLWLFPVAFAIAAMRRPSGGGGPRYNQTQSAGGLGGSSSPNAMLPPGATYFGPCLPGDVAFQDVWCARGGFVTTGVAGNGSAGQRSFSLIGSGLSNWKNQAGGLSKAVDENAKPLADAAGLIVGNAAKAAKTANKYGFSVDGLLDLLSDGDSAADGLLDLLSDGDSAAIEQ